MKKHIILSFAAASILFASCGGERVVIERVPDTVAQTTVPETTLPPTTLPKLSPDEQFIANLMVEYSWVVNNLGRVNLVDLGRTICQAIDEGMSFAQYLDLIIKYNIDAGAGGALLRESIWNFCPSEQWFLDAAIDELSRG